MVREGRVLISVATDPDFGSNYYVKACEVGAQVETAWSGGSIGVRDGHGFATNDKFIVVSEFPLTTKMRTVTGTTTGTISCSSVTVVAGDILVNLGADSETVAGTPDYDATGAVIYTDMDYSTSANESTVLTDSQGRYIYYHQGISIWELIRTSSGVLVAVYQSASTNTLAGPSSGTSTNNAVVLWDGIDGQTLKNSVVIANAGAVTGITTLATSGAVTVGGALGIVGALTGVTTLTASGAMSCAGAIITGTSTLGTVTASSTLNVAGTTTLQGAATLTGGVAGAMTATGNVTSGGHIRGAKATVSITGNVAFVTTDRILLDITNTSGTNSSCTLTAPSSQDGQILVLRVAGFTSDTFTLTESTTASLVGTMWAPNGAGDTLTLIASGSMWYELCRSDT